MQTRAVTLQLRPTEQITKVIMSGGFRDPRLTNRSAANGSGLFSGGPGLCLRSIDPTIQEKQPVGTANPPYGNDTLPIGCMANSKILNMPLSYAVAATAAYPNIDAYLLGNTPAGPYTYGRQVVLTTDIGFNGPLDLTYCDASAGDCTGGVYNPVTQTYSPLTKGQKPLAGTVSVWACVGGGSGGNSQGEGRVVVRGTER
jgi:hypothetical protein